MTERQAELKHLSYQRSYDCFCGYNCYPGTYSSAVPDRLEHIARWSHTHTYARTHTRTYSCTQTHHLHINTAIVLYMICIFKKHIHIFDQQDEPDFMAAIISSQLFLRYFRWLQFLPETDHFWVIFSDRKIIKMCDRRRPQKVDFRAKIWISVASN